MPEQRRIRHTLQKPRWPDQEETAKALLFQPLRQGRLQLHQRTWVPAMVPWRATEQGEVTEAVKAWYGRFAQGRPGAIVVEATGIRDIPSGPLLRIGHDRYLPGLEDLVQAVRRQGQGQSKLLVQLIDFLAVRRRPQPEKFFKRFLKLENYHRDRLIALKEDETISDAPEEIVREQLFAAGPDSWPQLLKERELSDLQYGYREQVSDLELPHIQNLPEVLPKLFAEAAVRAEKAGFDGVELHYAHAYTMASFLSRTNQRSDGYGGSKENRLRLALEVFQEVRKAVSDSFVVGCRYLADEVIAEGSRIEEAEYYGVEFARAGMDFLSLSKGGKFDDAKQPRIGHAVYPYTGPSGHECMPTIYSDARGPLGRNLPLAKAVREKVREAGFETPIVAAGGIRDFDTAEGALKEGSADIIGAARQSLADPDWFLKMQLGRGEEVRSCALTNYCEGLDQQHKQVTCRLWDRQTQTGEQEPMLSHDGKRRLVAPDWQP